MKRVSLTLLGLIAVVGCSSSGPPSSPPPPSTMPTAMAPTAANASSSTTPPPAAPAAMLPDKDMTHKLSADSPFFKSMPSGDAKADDTLKAGSKALVMVPGAKYSKIETQMGMTGYTLTANLDPLGK